MHNIDPANSEYNAFQPDLIRIQLGPGSLRKPMLKSMLFN